MASEPQEWDELAEAFSELLECADPEEQIQRLPDAGLREKVRDLWQHHIRAERENFLRRKQSSAHLPVFVEGQELSGRFTIQQFLGAGGMGEVYLATDRRLGGVVAIKTITRLLAPLKAIRKRFLQEVQTARQVTHPNVCRIHDFFEDGDSAYFTMEYLRGDTLQAAMMASLPVEAGLRHLREIGHGLQAAHEQGILHGDLKPGNVIVVEGRGAVVTDFGLARIAADSGSDGVSQGPAPAGSLGYMAPELQSGGGLSRASDYFAFGKIASELLPRATWWRPFCAIDPLERPKSLQPAFEALKPRNWRRYLIGASLVGAGGLTARIWQNASAASLPAGSVLFVNGVRASNELRPQARAARQLMIAGLAQSARFRLVPDADLFPTLRQIAPGVSLPTEGTVLDKLLAAARAGYWVDAQLVRTTEHLDLGLLVRRAQDGLAVMQTSLRGKVVSELASAAVGWLRRAGGETAEAVERTGPPPLSRSPEAVERFAEATELYASANPRQAAPLFEEAIRLDAEFARAYSGLAMCFNTMRRHTDAITNLEKAMSLAGSLADRDKAVIAASYYKLIEDPVHMVEQARKCASLHGSESQYQRLLAQALSWTGTPAAAVAYARRATELSPRSDMNWLELTVTLCEAGHYQDALLEFQRGREAGAAQSMLERGAGLAYLGLGEYDKAQEAFHRMGGPPRLVHGAGYLAGAVDVALAAWRQAKVAVRTQGNPAEEHQYAEHLAGGHYLLGQTGAASRELAARPELPLSPVHGRQVEAIIFWAARLGRNEIVEASRQEIEELRRRWPTGHTTSLLRFVDGIQARSRGKLDLAEEALTEATGSCFNPLACLEAAELAALRGQWDLAAERWKQFDACRGHLLKLYFPGFVLYGWHGQMLSAVHRGDTSTARRCAERILGCWGRANPQSPLVVAARSVVPG